MTNADKIRAMSDDELAEFLYRQLYPEDGPSELPIKYHMIRNFLKSEVQEDERRNG